MICLAQEALRARRVVMGLPRKHMRQVNATGKAVAIAVWMPVGVEAVITTARS